MRIHNEAEACNLQKSSSTPPEQEQQQQTNVHVYPDWAPMQAYYGPTMALSPYFNPAAAAAAASVHGPPPPPYMWGPPQHMMPPPYAAFYPHGGVYATLPVGPNLATTPLNIDSPAKSSGDSDRGLIKKLKGFDGLAMSIGNVNGEVGNDNGISHSSRETEGSSEGSDGNTTEGGQNGAKRSRKRSPSRMTGVAIPSAKVLGIKVGGGDLSPNSITALNLKNTPSATANMTSSIVPLIPNESVLQNDREMKRERRKQSNRDSARRSRLRKQAEAEELSIKVGALNSENLSLRSEINRLTDNSNKLKLQNAKLLEKLKEAQKEQVAEDLKLGSSLSTANLLSRVNNSAECLDGEQQPDSGGKLRQLLRADAVAAR